MKKIIPLLTLLLFGCGSETETSPINILDPDIEVIEFESPTQLLEEAQVETETDENGEVTTFAKLVVSPTEQAVLTLPENTPLVIASGDESGVPVKLVIEGTMVIK